MAAPRHPGKQRGHYPRPKHAQNDRRRLGVVINTNLNGTFYCTSAAVPAMVNQSLAGSSISSSVVGQMGRICPRPTTRQQGGIIAFTRPRRWKWPSSTSPPTPLLRASHSTEMVDAIQKRLRPRSKASFLWAFRHRGEIAKRLHSSRPTDITGQGVERQRRIPHVSED